MKFEQSASDHQFSLINRIERWNSEWHRIPLSFSILQSLPADQTAGKVAAVSELASRLAAQEKFAHVNTKGRVPTAEETKRIAKIFSSKIS